MERLIGDQLLLFHLSLPFQSAPFTGSPEVLWSLLQFFSSPQMKGQFIIDHYIKYFSEVPLLFKQQSSELAQLKDTHLLTIIINQLFKLCGTSEQQQINRAVWLGWRSRYFSKPLTPKSSTDLREEEWQPCRNTSRKWRHYCRDDLSGSTTSRLHWKRSHYHSKVKQKHWAHFCAYCNPFKSLFQYLVLAPLKAQAVRAQEQRAHFYLIHVQPDPAEAVLASNGNLYRLRKK